MGVGLFHRKMYLKIDIGKYRNIIFGKHLKVVIGKSHKIVIDETLGLSLSAHRQRDPSRWTAQVGERASYDQTNQDPK